MMRVATVASILLLGLVGCGEVTSEVNGAAPDAGPGGARGAGDPASDGGTATTTTSDGGLRVSDAGAATSRHGRCTSAKDCDGDPCVELVPGGFKVCSHPAGPPQACVDAGATPWPDECCGSCPGAHSTCTLAVRCGGAYMAPHNVCVTDECQTNADCTGTRPVCLPSGVRSDHRTCLADNECLTDADCKAAPNGACVLAGSVGPAGSCRSFTCGGATVDPIDGALRCVYGASCTDDADCPGGHCEESGGTLRCAAGARSTCPPPP